MTAQSDRIHKLLNDPELQGGFERLRQQYRDAMCDPKITDEDVLELRRMLLLLTRLEQDLEATLESGHLEDFRAAEKERPAPLGDIFKWRQKNR